MNYSEFLLFFFSQILVAIDLAMECTETQGVLWRQICDDEYMAYAVQECYYSVQNILNSMVDGVGRRWYSLSICLFSTDRYFWNYTCVTSIYASFSHW